MVGQLGTKIRHLALSGQKALSPRAIERVSEVRDLRSLVLADTPCPRTLLRTLSTLPQLRVLYLSPPTRPRAMVVNCGELAGLARCKRLCRLSLFDMVGIDDQVEAFFDLGSLRELAIAPCSISPRVLGLLMRSKPLRHLTIYCDWRKPIRRLVSGPSWLTSLSLGGSIVNPRLVERVREIESLRTLALTGRNVTDIALEPLRNHPRIASLDLAGTSITGASVPVLLSLPKLEAVNVESTAYGRGELQQLREARPTLRFYTHAC